MRQVDIEKQAARVKLLEILKPGDTVDCILRHTSKSGMMRRISFYGPGKRFLDGYIATLLGYKRDRHTDGLKVSGCGMDMGFSVVYDLGATLWPKGTEKPHGTRNGEPDRDGGYALKHNWL